MRYHAAIREEPARVPALCSDLRGSLVPDFERRLWEFMPDLIYGWEIAGRGEFPFERLGADLHQGLWVVSIQDWSGCAAGERANRIADEYPGLFWKLRELHDWLERSLDEFEEYDAANVKSPNRSRRDVPIDPTGAGADDPPPPTIKLSEFASLIGKTKRHVREVMRQADGAPRPCVKARVRGQPDEYRHDDMRAFGLKQWRKDIGPPKKPERST